jgi:hypothetical protein
MSASVACDTNLQRFIHRNLDGQGNLTHASTVQILVKTIQIDNIEQGVKLLLLLQAPRQGALRSCHTSRC